MRCVCAKRMLHGVQNGKGWAEHIAAENVPLVLRRPLRTHARSSSISSSCRAGGWPTCNPGREAVVHRRSALSNVSARGTHGDVTKSTARRKYALKRKSEKNLLV
jgi:hypothetical protein